MKFKEFVKRYCEFGTTEFEQQTYYYYYMLGKEEEK